MSRRDVACCACLTVGGFAGLFAAGYYVLLATETPASWIGHLMRLREN